MQRKIIALLVVALVVTGIIFLGRGRASRTDDGNHLPADSASMKTVKPTVRIFMENSGSMNGFVTINSEFKNALGHLIAKTNGFYEGTKLFFINDAIHHAAVCDNLNDFVLHLNPQTMQVGNTGSTDINKIFGMILDRTKNDTVSILVSDCVYDVDNVGNLLSAASSSTTGTFMKAIRQAKEKDSDFAVILMQCESKFYGYHYEGNMPMVCNGIRPYYVIIMGKKEAVLELDEHLELENTPTCIYKVLSFWLFVGVFKIFSCLFACLLLFSLLQLHSCVFSSLLALFSTTNLFGCFASSFASRTTCSIFSTTICLFSMPPFAGSSMYFDVSIFLVSISCRFVSLIETVSVSNAVIFFFSCVCCLLLTSLFLLSIV